MLWECQLFQSFQIFLFRLFCMEINYSLISINQFVSHQLSCISFFIDLLKVNLFKNTLLLVTFIIQQLSLSKLQIKTVLNKSKMQPKLNNAIKPVQIKPVANKPGIKIVHKQQEIPKAKQGFTQFPSSKLTGIKTVDPFSQKKGNSFSHLYSSGAIPCKIQHGTVNMKIKWNSNVKISQLPYNPLLVTCFEGLIQEKHPYGFIAYHVCKEMIEDEQSANKLIELLPKIVWHLRTALSHKNQTICSNALQILKLLSDKVGSHLNSHVKSLVTPIKKHMSDKKLKEKAFGTLRTLQDNGGPQVNKIIKAAIPTYSNN